MMQARWILAACVVAAGCSGPAAEPSPVVSARQRAPLQQPWFAGLADESDEIAEGRVLDVIGEARGPADEPGIFSRVRLAVEQSFRGSQQQTLEFWLEGGRLERRARIVSLQSRFEIGERVLVFLTQRGGFLRLTRMGLGKWIPSAAEFAPDPRALVHLASPAGQLSLTRADLTAQLAARRLR